MDGCKPSRDLRARPWEVPGYADYRPLETSTVAERIAACPGIAERLGGRPADWDVREVGDGNLNFVYIVTGSAGSVCCKQALPYVRLVGESWPLPLDRAFYEHAALVREAQDAGHVPEVLHFDRPQTLIVMENLGRHVVWRRARVRAAAARSAGAEGARGWVLAQAPRVWRTQRCARGWSGGR